LRYHLYAVYFPLLALAMFEKHKEKGLNSLCETSAFSAPLR